MFQLRRLSLAFELALHGLKHQLGLLWRRHWNGEKPRRVLQTRFPDYKLPARTRRLFRPLTPTEFQKPRRLLEVLFQENPLFVWRLLLQLTGLRRYSLESGTSAK